MRGAIPRRHLGPVAEPDRPSQALLGPRNRLSCQGCGLPLHADQDDADTLPAVLPCGGVTETSSIRTRRRGDASASPHQQRSGRPPPGARPPLPWRLRGCLRCASVLESTCSSLASCRRGCGRDVSMPTPTCPPMVLPSVDVQGTREAMTLSTSEPQRFGEVLRMPKGESGMNTKEMIRCRR